MSSTPATAATAADDAKTKARKKAESTPLENAQTLRGIYDSGYEFPKWVLDEDRWKEDGDKSHKFDDTIVVYDDDDELNQVKELVEQREPVNVCINGVMQRSYNQNELEKNFGWKTGAYGKSENSKLYPNIGIYCHARVTNDVSAGAEEKNVHVMNLIGYGFDSDEQPDFIYFLNNYGNGASNLKNLNDDKKQQFKEDLIQRYRKIWLKACYICKFKRLKHLWYYGVGNNNFSSGLPSEWAGEKNFYNEIFAPAFGINSKDGSKIHTSNNGDLNIPINFCNDNGIKVLNLGAGNKGNDTFIPQVLFNGSSNTEDTLYINAWDPWSIIGNENNALNSLDSIWGRNSNMSVLGWSMTNSKLLPDIMGGASAETSKTLSMKQILDKIKAEGGSKGDGSPAQPPPPPPPPSCEIDASKSNIKNITPKCQDAIFSLAPTEKSKENILKKHLSVLRTDTEKATNNNLPAGSATIVDLNDYKSLISDDKDNVDSILRDDVNIKVGKHLKEKISFILQAATASSGQSDLNQYSLKNMSNSVYNCLYLANNNKVKKIAFPILGGRIFFKKLLLEQNITKNILYQALLKGAVDFLTDYSVDVVSIKKIIFCSNGKQEYNNVIKSGYYTSWMATTNLNNKEESTQNVTKQEVKNLISDSDYLIYSITTEMFNNEWKKMFEPSSGTKDEINKTELQAFLKKMIELNNEHDNFKTAFDEFPKFLKEYNPDGKSGFYDKIYPSTIYNGGDDINKFNTIIEHPFSSIFNIFKSDDETPLAIVNAANTEIHFGGGLSGLFKMAIGNPGKDLIDTRGVEIKKVFKTAVDAYIANTTAASSPPPATPTPPVVKNPFADVIKDLEGKLTQDSENDAEIKKLKITLPTDFLYPTDGDVYAKKNLNSAEPGIKKMIEDFENASTDDATKTTRDFYLGACRSIKAAYQLERGDKTDDTSPEGMRAKLLLNLRKNSLLLKVPARWDYVEMKMGVEPELTEEEVNAKYEKLQKECETLKQSKGNDYATSEEAYKLAEQLIPLGEKIESDKLEKKNQFVIDNYPATKITYPPIADVNPGFKVIIDQNSENCGRAALANFFGTEEFLIKGNPAKTEEIFDLKNQRPKKIDMSSICHLNKKYSDIFTDVPNNKKDKKDYEFRTKCPTSENYSIDVLSIVLQVLGYEDLTGITFNKENMTQYDDNKAKLNKSYNNKDVLGYLININEGHWICYKRESVGSNNNSFYRINSIDDNFNDARTLEKLIEFDSIENNNNFIQLHPITKNNDQNNQKIFDILSKIEGNINFYKDQITKNETSNKWKLFKKDVTSELAKDSDLFTIDNQVRILNYLSNLPSSKSLTNIQITIGFNDTNSKYDSIQSKILSLDKIQKKQVIDIFIQYIKNNLSTLDFITADNCNLRNLGFNKEDNTFEPDIDAEIRYYNSLTQTCKYNRNKNFTENLIANGYYKSANALLKTIDTLFQTSEFTNSSPAGGGFKPRHNPITNHTASKSRHNSSFKASSSSKSKGKSHNRSHTQRVK